MSDSEQPAPAAETPEVPTAADSMAHAMADALASLWWLVLLRGVLLVILGFYALFAPGLTIESIVWVLGIFLIFDGFISIFAGIAGDVSSRGWSIGRGVLQIVIGLFVVGNSFLFAAIGATVIIYVIAFCAILGGVFEIMTAFSGSPQIEGSGWLVVSGIISILFGIMLLIAPMLSASIIVRVIGVFVMIYGFSLIGASFQLRKIGQAMGQT